VTNGGSSGRSTLTQSTDTATSVDTPEPGTADTDRDDGILTWPVTVFLLAVEHGLGALATGLGLVLGGMYTLVAEPGRVFRVLVRSGRMDAWVDYTVNAQEAIELALLEAAPLLAGLTGVIAAGGDRIRTGSSRSRARAALADPKRQTDFLAATLAVALLLVYIDRLPTQSQITMRYLVPIIPAGLYGLGRLPAVRGVFDDGIRSFAIAYLATLATAAVMVSVANVYLGLALGEAMQLHAILALGSAVALGIWSLLAGVGYRVGRQTGVAALAVPAAVTTLFLACTGMVYFRYGTYGVALTGWLGEWLAVLL
jgi:hypothetical protein